MSESSATLVPMLPGVAVDLILLHSVIHGVHSGLAMTGLTPPPVGASSLHAASRPIAVLVGLCGRSNGTMTLNMTEGGLLHIAEKLTGEKQTSLNEETLDAIAEIGNMVAGCIKEELVGSEYELTNISVPALILGANYDFYLARGFNTVTVEFELSGIPIATPRDRFFTATVSLLRRST